MQTNDPILVFNSGSSSLKVGLFRSVDGEEQVIVQGEVDRIGHGSGKLELADAHGETIVSESHAIATQEEALERVAAAVKDHVPSPPIAVGHRIVHGGPHLREHCVITPDVLKQLEAAIHFAPLHIPDALRILRKAEEVFAGTPQIACFDTAFHRSIPLAAAQFPIPKRYYDAGVLRYGFHGISCESVLRRIEKAEAKRIVIAHLGGGSSVTAVLDGKSRDTSMGLSPTGGVPMALRSGDLDPAVLLYILRTEKLSADELETLVNHECGMKALSGGETDMQALLSRDDDAARLAIEIYTTDLRKTIGGYGALMGDIDLLVFTGGIGQHAAPIRNRILDGLGAFGLSATSEKVVAVPAKEEIQMARHCRSILRSEAPQQGDE
jgi:acetate kinase